jgi:hypothetical protein
MTLLAPSSWRSLAPNAQGFISPQQRRKIKRKRGYSHYLALIYSNPTNLENDRSTFTFLQNFGGG